jgi:GH25 family lysozyme M1 (1,4-beta-N-acetylmuramidase)
MRTAWMPFGWPPPEAGQGDTETRQRIIAEAEAREGIPYQMVPPPDGVETTDCSLYVLTCYEAAGVPFHGVRTAEQIRQASVPIGWDEVQVADLLFFEHTYEPSEPPGPDGHTASHIGISLGAGSFLLWNAVEPAVTLTNINTSYWQQHLLEARRSPRLQGAAPPTPVGDTVPGIDVSSHQSTDLTAYIQKAAAQHVVVRMYMADIEGPSPHHSVAQTASARQNGASVSNYFWLYSGIDPRYQVQQAIDTMIRCGTWDAMLWIDVESYEGSFPTPAEIQEALDACADFGVHAGIYSGAWVFQELGNPQFPGVPLWVADYDGSPEIDTPPFGGMVVWGKQYADVAPDGSPLDMDSFLPEAVA